jgi:hypothetical protein
MTTFEEDVMLEFKANQALVLEQLEKELTQIEKEKYNTANQESASRGMGRTKQRSNKPKVPRDAGES